MVFYVNLIFQNFSVFHSFFVPTIDQETEQNPRDP